MSFKVAGLLHILLEVIREPSFKEQNGAGHMNQSHKNYGGTLIAHIQAAEVLKPSNGALHDPPVFIAPEFASVLMGGYPIIGPGRNNGLNALRIEAASDRVAVVALVLPPNGCNKSYPHKFSIFQ